MPETPGSHPAPKSKAPSKKPSSRFKKFNLNKLKSGDEKDKTKEAESHEEKSSAETERNEAQEQKDGVIERQRKLNQCYDLADSIKRTGATPAKEERFLKLCEELNLNPDELVRKVEVTKGFVIEPTASSMTDAAQEVPLFFETTPEVEKQNAIEVEWDTAFPKSRIQTRLHRNELIRFKELVELHYPGRMPMVFDALKNLDANNVFTALEKAKILTDDHLHFVTDKELKAWLDVNLK